MNFHPGGGGREESPARTVSALAMTAKRPRGGLAFNKLTYTASAYDHMTVTDAERTRRYDDAIAAALKRAPGACVVDVGTGANATFGVIALQLGATHVVCIEMVEAAVAPAYCRLQLACGVERPRRLRLPARRPPGRAIVVADDAVGARRCRVSLVLGTARQTVATEWFRRMADGHTQFVLVHELFDDIASFEDAHNTVKELVQALREAQPLARLHQVPVVGETVGRALALPPGHAAAAATAAPFVLSHDSGVAPNSAAEVALERIDFVRGSWRHPPASLPCARGSTHLALRLRIVFASGATYDVWDPVNDGHSNWRTVLLRLPPVIIDGSKASDHSLRVRMAADRSPLGQTDYTMDYTFQMSLVRTAGAAAAHGVVALSHAQLQATAAARPTKTKKRTRKK